MMSELSKLLPLEVFNTKKNIYLFGAGRVAQIVYDLLSQDKITIKGFLVSDTRKNKAVYNGLPVFDAKQIATQDKDSIVIIALLERGEKKLVQFCKDLGFSSVLSLPNDIFNYDTWNAQRYKSPLIEVTAKIGCAVNCHYCPQNVLLNAYFKDNKQRQSSMTFADYKRYLDLMPQETIVDFSGFVEPFLNADSLMMMEYTVQTGHDCTLFTTFRGLSMEELDRLVKIPFRYVCVHTADADGFANIPVTDEYLSIFSKALNATKPNGSPFIDVANCQSEPHPAVLELTEGKLKIYCEMSDRAGNLDKDDKHLAHVHKKGRIRCSRAVAMNHFVLLPDGSLALCCNDFGLKHIVGNLNTASYSEIMAGSEMKRIRKAMTEEGDDVICRKCYFATEED